MKELKILESWADSVIQERIEDRPLSRSQDIQYQASQKFPDRSPEQALQLYVATKMADNDQMNLDQNKLINAQKRENEKLRRNLQDLGNELHNHERTALDTEKEITRLKQLSAKLGPSGIEQQLTAKADADKLQKMIADLENLKDKPGIDNNKFKELSDKVEQLKSKPVDNNEVEKISLALQTLNKQNSVNDKLFNNVMQRLAQTEKELADKERRFQKSISRNAGKIGDWGNKFKDLDLKIKDIDNRSEQVVSRSEQLLQNIEDTKDEQQDLIDRLFDLVSRLSPQAQQTVQSNVTQLKKLSKDIKDIEDKEEADLAKVGPDQVTGQDLELARDNQQSMSDDELAQSLANKIKSNTIPFPSKDQRNMINKKRMAEDNSKKYEEQPPVPQQPTTPHEYTSQELEVAIREMMDLFQRRYPADYKEYPEQVIRRIIRRSVGGSLLILGDDITVPHIWKYLDRVQRMLHKSAPPTMPELPGIPRTNPRGPRSDDYQIESFVNGYEKKLTEITGGY